MKRSDFSGSFPGQLVSTTAIHHRLAERGIVNETLAGEAFVPDPLPPAHPTADEVKAEFYEQIVAAERGLSELEGAAKRLPNPHLLIRPLLRREAILSSKIENTIASADQLVLFEEDPALLGDRRSMVQEVHNYVRAIEHATHDQRPICANLLKECHRILLSEDAKKRPGQFRDQQNWIGRESAPFHKARFVPPPPDLIEGCMSDLERFINNAGSVRDTYPRLVRFAFIHYQFETIHPFIDGNGRVGRMLVTLLLCEQAQLSRPLLHISGFFERHRQEYYDCLYRVSTKGSWNDWIEFFLTGVAEQAHDALRRADALVALQHDFRRRISEKRSSANLHLLVDKLFARPALTVKEAGRIAGVTPAAAGELVRKLVDHGILKEVTGRRRDRVFMAMEIIDIINRDFG